MRHALLANAATAVLLVACGGDAASDAPTLADGFCTDALDRVGAYMATVESTPQPDEGGTVVVATTGDLQGMMGLTTDDYNTHQHQIFVHLMTLVRYDERFDPVPYLAESWEWNSDWTELTFHLRDDVVWHDGTPTTARDVEFTYARAVDPVTTFANPAYFQNYESAEVLDDFTIRFRVRPHAMPLDTWRATPIMPAHLLADVPPAELGDHPFGAVCPVGNGPFRFVEHRQGDRWTFAANPAFPAALGGRPSIDRYVFRVIPDASTLLTELLNGDIDIYQQLLPDQAATVDEADGLHVAAFAARDYLFLAWNTRRPLLSDPLVRRALTMAIDRQALVDHLLGGRGVVANTGVSPVHWAFDPAASSVLPYDPAGARRLLAERGWQDRDGDGFLENAEGTRFAFELKTNAESGLRSAIAEIIQGQLAELGVEVTLASSDFGTFVGDITGAERRFDAFLLTYNNDFRLDERDMFHSGAVDGNFAFAGMGSPTLDRLIDTLQAIPDPAAALPVWREYQAEIVSQQPYMYLFYPDRLAGVSDRIENISMDVRGEWVGIHDWRVPADRRKYTTPDRP